MSENLATSRYSRPELLLACLLGSFLFLLVALVWSAPRLFPLRSAASTQSTLLAVAVESKTELIAEEEPLAQLVAATTPATKAPRERYIRAGLSTAGGPLQIWTPSAATLTDALQPARRLTVPSGSTLVFAHEPEVSFAANGQTYRGPIQVRVGGGVYRAWRAPRLSVAGGPARVTTNGDNPRWGRPYRGGFEITEQGYSFEPAKHAGALALVNIVPLEEYLKGVVPWEMSPSAPFEALKAQAICARSETLSKIESGRHAKDGYDICDYDHCQGYPGTENEKESSSRAVIATRGIILHHGGKIADAVYGTNSGGITAGSGDVWRGTPPAYLQSVFDFSPQLHPATAKVVRPNMSEADWLKYCSQNLPSFAQPTPSEIEALATRRANSARTAALFGPNDLPEFYRWTRVIAPDDLAAAVSRVAPMKTATELRVLERAPSGRIKRLQVRGVTTGDQTVEAVFEGDSQIRAILSGRLGSTTALPSSTFVPLAQRDENGKVSGFVLKGAGWGHGVGMCQRGAQNRALAGQGARQILNHYYKGVTLLRVS